MKKQIRFERRWAMPNKWTFTIEPIKRLLKEEIEGGFWVDPFAGKYSPATLTNDLNPEMPTESHIDALEFLKGLESRIAEGVILDPPYSPRQAAECYNKFGLEKLTAIVTNMKYWAEVKDEVSRIIKRKGKAICCGWNTNGLGWNRGFRTERILIVPHGGTRNDTLVTVEAKFKRALVEVFQ